MGMDRGRDAFVEIAARVVRLAQGGASYCDAFRTGIRQAAMREQFRLRCAESHLIIRRSRSRTGCTSDPHI